MATPHRGRPPTAPRPRLPARMTLRSISLFSGYGGLDLAVERATGAHTVWMAEYEPPTEANPNPKQDAARVLAAHWPHTPNLGDVSQINWTGVDADIVTAG